MADRRGHSGQRAAGLGGAREAHFSLADRRLITTISSMAGRSRTRWLPLAALGLWLWSDLASAQFNPRGRRRGGEPGRPPATAHPSPTPRPPATRRSPASKPPASPSGTRGAVDPKPTPGAPERPAAPSPQAEHAPAAGQSNKPSNEALIARYTAIALQQPGVPFPLQRLSELYRERDGSLTALTSDFEKRLTAEPSSLPLLMALAWICESDGDRVKAAEFLNRARAAHPKHSAPLVALANLKEAEGDKAAAASALEQALPLQTEALEREQALRKLRAFALDAGDLVRARQFHERLVKEAKGSSFVRAELGKELLDRRLTAEAVTAFEDAAKAAAGDNRALAPALRDLAKAQAASGKSVAAVKSLERALGLTTPDSGTHREILEVMVEVYRAGNRMPELLTLLERQAGRDPARLALLGSLYEEAGRLDEALTRYRQALSASPNNTDVRIRLLRLLELRGDLLGAVAEYKVLISQNPRSPEYVFQLADLYQKLGNTKAALDELAKLGERSQSDPEILASTIDFYERIGESDKALHLLEKLVAQAPRDHQHLIALGERYFAAGDEKRAEATWRKLLEVVPVRAHAEFLLGEVYLEHDMTPEALRSLGKACELAPDNVQYRKTLALALERTGATSGKAARLSNYAEAQALWERILSGSDSVLVQREARQHITTLWSLQGSLKERVAPLAEAFQRKPPHLASGRMLAEVYQRLNQWANAEQVLRQLVELVPRDVAAWSTLERVLVTERKLGEASEVAKRLLELEPKRALEHYQRLARYAADLYRDDEAIEYAAKAVALSPDDAEGQKRLGDMYRRRQDVERALFHYRKALTKNDRLFPVYFDLAELLLLKRNPAEADQLLRTVLRTAVEDDVIARAARMSMQLHITDGSLGALEQELLPLSLARTSKPVYRSLLLELYSAWMLPLAQQLESPDTALASAARAELIALGQRSVKPLLDALGDPKRDEQRTAVELLTFIRNPNANLPLIAYATGVGEPELQTKAMLAVGLAGADNVSAQLEPLLFAEGRASVDESSPVALAAAWSYTRLSSKKTTPKLLLLAQSDSPTAQALALVALAQRRELRVLELLPDLIHEGSAPFTRVAAVYAAGELGRQLPAAQASKHWPTLRQNLRALAQSNEVLLRATALVALARLGDERVPALVARGLIHSDPTLRDYAVRAMAVYRQPLAAAPQNEPVRAPVSDSGRLDAERLLEALLPPVPSPELQAELLPRLEADLVKEARPLLQQSEAAVQTLALALTPPGGLGFAPLTSRLNEVSPAARARAETAAAHLVAALVPEFVVQSTHPNVAVRTAAVRVLATQTSDDARGAIATVLEHGDEETCRAVLAALVDFPNPALLAPIAKLLQSERPWPLRQLAALTLNNLAPGVFKTPSAAPLAAPLPPSTPQTAAEDAVKSALLRAAEHDANAFVREQALIAWTAWSGDLAKPVLERARRNDPETRVRHTAQSLLERKTP